MNQAQEIIIPPEQAPEPSTEPKEKRRAPRLLWVLLGVLALSGGLYGAFVLSPRFADFFNENISSVFRAVMATLSGWIPFSLAEALLLFLPVLFFLLLRLGLRKYADTWRDVLRFCLGVLLAVALVLLSFVVGFAPAYRGSTLAEKLGLESRAVSKEDLYETALILAEAINREAEGMNYSDGTDFSVMPYGFDQMNDRLIEAFERACDRYGFVQRLDSNLKPVMLSKPMSYTHITGVYTFFTGEANLNVYFPDYTLPFTAAHELSHQRGIAREDEANFMAFLVCKDAEDAYLRYCGYMNLYEYVASALYSASPQLYWQVQETLSQSVRQEMAAYSRFFEQFEDSVAGEISEAVNNTVLQIHGTEGVKSYGMVVDLAVAYYLQ